ncbi:STAS domain-containing protein [Kitasatospora sp. NPDC051914]|uniref:STAS domain-containing protein n=1 Tax=Kitasatospora sp. NPDC051914 TaxID=3154945 RepID=UPI00343908D6
MTGRLKSSTARVGAAVVCTFAGDLHMANEPGVRTVLNEALGLLPQVLAVDLSGVELFTSSGLNALLQVRSAAADRGVPVVLLAPSGAVRRVLELTEAAELFPVCASAEEAARHARPPQAFGT